MQQAQDQPNPDAPHEPHEPHQARELTPGIVTNPRVMVGKPVIAGRRITVELIMDNLAAGRSIENVMANYGLTANQIRDALRYAHHLVYEDAQQKMREGGQ
ncbi:MAG TPA: DUF433 domain-containing protein [Ktedonobacterales bacterium]|nr:DUF433 domain-containing protein [Ktedonobacterales bacterium]